MPRSAIAHTDTRKRRSAHQRIALIQIILGVLILIVSARLIEIQVLRYDEFVTQAEAQHFDAVRLSVRRGNILSASSKTNTESIVATNRTLSMVYIDPVEVDDPAQIADAIVNTPISDISKDKELIIVCVICCVYVFTGSDAKIIELNASEY